MDNIDSFIHYDAISDTVHTLDKNTFVKFTVKLSRKDADGNRIHFHNEYKYNSKYLDTQYGYSIKRHYDFYFSIENKVLDVYIQIRMQNMVLLRIILSDISRILFNESYWSVLDGRLVTKGTINPFTYSGLPMDKWLMFEIIPILYENESKKGVRITLSDTEKYIDVTMDSFLGLVYLINDTDMVTYASTMIDYISNKEIYNKNSSFIQPLDNKSVKIQTAVEEPKVVAKGRRIPGTQLTLEDMK